MNNSTAQRRMTKGVSENAGGIRVSCKEIILGEWVCMINIKSSVYTKISAISLKNLRERYITGRRLSVP